MASDPDAAYHMEVQVKHAIYCELKAAAADARILDHQGPRRIFGTRDITTEENRYLPDSWGALVQLSFQVQEKSSLTPGIALKTLVDSAPSGLRLGPALIGQSYQTGIGGTLSSENITYDKYNAFYTARDLAIPINRASSCYSRPENILGDHPSSSSPFVDASNLGIRAWVTRAVRVLQYHSSSHKAADETDGPLGSSSGPTASDASTYSNKFTIVSSANVAPTWNLIKVGTSTSPLFDTSRTRTHELIITLGPGALPRSKTSLGSPVLSGPSEAVINSHLASQIGSAVANALR